MNNKLIEKGARDPQSMAEENTSEVQYPSILSVLAYDHGDVNYENGKLIISFDITGIMPEIRNTNSWIIHLHKSKVAALRKLISEVYGLKEETAVRCKHCGEKL